MKDIFDVKQHKYFTRSQKLIYEDIFNVKQQVFHKKSKTDLWRTI